MKIQDKVRIKITAAWCEKKKQNIPFGKLKKYCIAIKELVLLSKSRLRELRNWSCLKSKTKKSLY